MLGEGYRINLEVFLKINFDRVKKMCHTVLFIYDVVLRVEK